MADKLPKISIVIPVYGVEPYIKECLQSVMQQDYPGDLECVIVNDCTPDNSMTVVNEMLSSYRGNIHFVVEHHDRNKGLSAARNTGMKRATGDYVYLLDSDDTITPNCIRVLAEPLAARPYDMVIADYQAIGNKNPLPPLDMPQGAVTDPDAIRKARAARKWYQMAVNKLYNTQTLRREGLTFKEGLYHEDELWSAQVACVIKSMYVVAKHKTYLYKIRENSITTAKNHQRRLTAMQTVIEDLDRFIGEHHLRNDLNANRILLDMMNIFLFESYRQGQEVCYTFYETLRQKAHVPLSIRFRFNGLNPKSIVRDLHYLLPLSIAKKYYWYSKKIFATKEAQ